ncbi:hypothetical protein F2Q70_00006379 [Brassica cretica]|uniref:Uncharacterized protein n=1 Tax=Brassica cretica TaxID=69181 RepID=A0A8S9IQE6_BRACR|nr:hypothetical protein F2Q70_00006379 [Brassica cretica]
MLANLKLKGQKSETQIMKARFICYQFKFVMETSNLVRAEADNMEVSPGQISDINLLLANQACKCVSKLPFAEPRKAVPSTIMCVVLLQQFLCTSLSLQRREIHAFSETVFNCSQNPLVGFFNVNFNFGAKVKIVCKDSVTLKSEVVGEAPRWIALVASKWVHRRIVKKLSLWSSWTCAILVIFNGRKFVNVCFGLGLEARVLKNTERIRVFSRYCDSFSLRFLFVYDHLLIKDFCTSKLFSMSLFIHRTRTMEVGLSELIIGLLQFENFVDQCHKGLTARLLRRRQNVDPKVYTKYLIVFESKTREDNVGNDILRTQRCNQMSPSSRLPRPTLYENHVLQEARNMAATIRAVLSRRISLDGASLSTVLLSLISIAVQRICIAIDEKPHSEYDFKPSRKV